MPPKRSVPAPPTLGGRTPRRTRRTPAPPEGSPPTPERDQRRPQPAVSIASRLTPRAVRYSTTYGAAAFDPGSAEKSRPLTTVTTTDLNAATKRARENVQEANKKDAEERAREEAAAVAARKRKDSATPSVGSRGSKRQRTTMLAPPPPPPPPPPPSPPQPEVSQEESPDREMPDAEDGETVDQLPQEVAGPINGTNGRRSSPEPSSALGALDAHQGNLPTVPGSIPRSTADASSDEVDLVHPYDDGSPQKNRPVTPGDRVGPTGRRAPRTRILEASAAATERSFNLESILYQDATVETPAPSNSGLEESLMSPPAQDPTPRPPPLTRRSPSSDGSSSDIIERPRLVTELDHPTAPSNNYRVDPIQPPEELEDPHRGMARQTAIRNGLLPPDPDVGRGENLFSTGSLRPTDFSGSGFGPSRLQESENFVRSLARNPDGLAFPRASSANPFANPRGPVSVRAGSAPLASSRPSRRVVTIEEEPEPPHRQPQQQVVTAEPPLIPKRQEPVHGAVLVDVPVLRPNQTRSIRQVTPLSKEDAQPPRQADSPNDVQMARGAEWVREKFSDVWNHPLCSEVLLAVGVFTAILAAILALFSSLNFVPRQFEGYPLDTGVHWYGADWRRNIGQFIPRSPFTTVTMADDQYSYLLEAWKSHDRAIAGLKRADQMSDSALEKLSKALPKVIRLEPDKSGHPVISKEFWLALKDLAMRDEDMLTLSKAAGRGGGKAISELHWSAISKRIKDSNILSPLRPASSNSASAGEDFEKWLKSNEKKVRAILGVTPDDSSVTDEDIEALVRKHMASERDSVVQLVLKDDFISRLRDEAKDSLAHVKGELTELHEKYKELLEKINESSAPHTVTTTIIQHDSSSTKAGAGMTKEELRRLAHQELRRAVGDLQLDALARGRLSSFWDHGLSNRVNYFTESAGAIINLKHTSPTYQPLIHRLRSAAWRQGNKRPLAPAFPIFVMRKWEEEGDCWCAAAKGKSGEAISASVEIQMERIIPQNLVVEHISPLETVDPGSMPRHIEVWAEMDEDGTRRALADWSFAAFQPPLSSSQSHSHSSEVVVARDKPLLDAKFVKIAEFEFDNKTTLTARGKVFAFSPQLLEFEAATDHVIVRARTNYGADHTCFYRLKMYGEPRPDL